MTHMDPPDYVIWSFEHDAWWRPGSWGYTRELAEAGHYMKAAAAAIVMNANSYSPQCNETMLLLNEAQASGPPPRYLVVPEHNQHGGPGWAIFDRHRRRLDGGWFADSAAAERTAAVLNRRDP
jgi:hypothetical protein